MLNTLNALAWRLAALVVTRPAVADWLIERAKRTPYQHITSQDGSSMYMGRWWLFNAYGKGPDGEALPARWRWLPSLRIHHIMRPDRDRHLHDHPWNARTIVLRGWYEEERPCPGMDHAEHIDPYWIGVSHCGKTGCRDLYRRTAGFTGRLLFGQYYRISEVSNGGVWTLFMTWRYRGTWGFEVDGAKVPWREYLGGQ